MTALDSRAHVREETELNVKHIQMLHVTSGICVRADELGTALPCRTPINKIHNVTKIIQFDLGVKERFSL